MCLFRRCCARVGQALFGSFVEHAETGKMAETDSQKTRNGELVTYVNETAEITVGHEDVVDT